MSPYTDYFFITTAEDQQNYFTGDFKPGSNVNSKEISSQLAPGKYRVIDGELSQILVGLSPDEIRSNFNKK